MYDKLYLIPSIPFLSFLQIGILLGDFMETLQSRYDEEVIIKAEKEAIKKLPKKEIVLEGELALPGLGSDALPKEGEGNKFAGFF